MDRQLAACAPAAQARTEGAAARRAAAMLALTVGAACGFFTALVAVLLVSKMPSKVDGGPVWKPVVTGAAAPRDRVGHAR